MEFRIQDCLGLRHMGRRSFFQFVVNSNVNNAQILEALTLRNPSEPPGKKRHARILYIEQISKLHDFPVSISNNKNKELLIICNKWSLKISLFTKVFIKRSVLIFGRALPFFLRLYT